MRGAQEVELRDAVFAEIDYSFAGAQIHGRAGGGARLHDPHPPLEAPTMEGYRSQLFDLENDPNEFDDLGGSADHANIRAELHERLFRWLRTRATRITISSSCATAPAARPSRASSSANGRPRKPSPGPDPTTGWSEDAPDGRSSG